MQNYRADELDIPIGDRLNLCYASTIVTKGRGVGITVGTGMNTQIGIIAAAISGKQKQDEDAEQPPLFHRIMERIKFIMFVAALLASFAHR